MIYSIYLSHVQFKNPQIHPSFLQRWIQECEPTWVSHKNISEPADAPWGKSLCNTGLVGRERFAGFTKELQLSPKYQCHITDNVLYHPWLQTETYASVFCSARGKPCAVGNYESNSLESWHNNGVLLAYLLNINSSPGKHIHNLRVMSALLIAMAETKIGIVSPRVYFCWVWREEKALLTSTAPHSNVFTRSSS